MDTGDLERFGRQIQAYRRLDEVDDLARRATGDKAKALAAERKALQDEIKRAESIAPTGKTRRVKGTEMARYIGKDGTRGAAYRTTQEFGEVRSLVDAQCPCA